MSQTTAPIPALTFHEMGLCAVIQTLTQLQVEGCPDGSDLVPDTKTIFAWLDNEKQRLTRAQKADILACLNVLEDADIVEKGFYSGVWQYHLTDLGHDMLTNALRAWRARPNSTPPARTNPTADYEL